MGESLVMGKQEGRIDFNPPLKNGRWGDVNPPEKRLNLGGKNARFRFWILAPGPSVDLISRGRARARPIPSSSSVRHPHPVMKTLVCLLALIVPARVLSAATTGIDTVVSGIPAGRSEEHTS